MSWWRRHDQQRFRNRLEAGRLLGQALADLGLDRPVVEALPRGGVPVGVEVARALDAPLDVVVVRKLGVPWQPELAFGAVGEGGVRVLNPSVARMLPEADLEAVTRREQAEVERRVTLWRGPADRHEVRSRTAVVVDDGVATGATVRAAVGVLRAAGAARVVVAVPVVGRDVATDLRQLADDVVAVLEPQDLHAVGIWYEDFRQVPDDEVRRILTANRRDDAPGEQLVPTDAGPLPAVVQVPPDASGLVVFAHGSGSSRHSPRNAAVAAHLRSAGLGTVLTDLLTEVEATDRRRVFDVPLLASRLLDVTRWTSSRWTSSRWTSGLDGHGAPPVGYFGASTGAAAALLAAADEPRLVRAVVSRGGRPDLVGNRLADVTAPTLLVVGGNDQDVLRLNQQAQQRLGCPSALEVVPGATHLFEEPGALDTVSRLATAWFLEHLP